MTMRLRKITVTVLIAGPFVLAVAPALVVPVCIYILFKAYRAIKVMRRVSWRDTIRDHWIISLTAFALCLFVILTSVVYCAERIITEDQARKEFHFVIQILSGNWSGPPYLYPDQSSAPPAQSTAPPKADRYALWKLSATASVSIVLNLISLGGITLAFGIIINQRTKERTMRLAQVYSARDASIRTSINVLLDRLTDAKRLTEQDRTEIKSIIAKGFKDGNEVWTNEHLPILFGEEEGRKMKELLEKKRDTARFDGSKLVIG